MSGDGAAPGAAFRFPQEREPTLDEIRFMAQKVAQVHGFSHPAMVELAGVVDVLAVNPEPTPVAMAAWKRARELTAGFTPWEGACGTVHKLFSGLKTCGSAVDVPPS